MARVLTALAVLAHELCTKSYDCVVICLCVVKANTNSIEYLAISINEFQAQKKAN